MPWSSHNGQVERTSRMYSGDLRRCARSHQLHRIHSRLPPKIWDRVPDKALREHQFRSSMQKYDALFAMPLKRCGGRVQILYLQMAQHFSENMFLDLYHLVQKKYVAAANNAQSLMELVEVLKSGSNHERSIEAITIFIQQHNQLPETGEPRHCAKASNNQGLCVLQL